MTPLLCRLGFHAPAWPPRWHDGLYVARCARCGRGIVRAGREGWRAPEGLEVRVAQPERASAPAAAGESAEAHARAGASFSDEWPEPKGEAAVATDAPRVAADRAGDGEPAPVKPRRPIRSSPPIPSSPVDEDTARASPSEARLLWLGAGLAGAGVVAGAGAALLALSAFGSRPPPPPAPPPTAPAPAVLESAHADVVPAPPPTPPVAGPCPSYPARATGEDGRIVLSARDGSRFTVARPGTPCWTVSYRPGRRR